MTDETILRAGARAIIRKLAIREDGRVCKIWL